jgi:hypothetical protein
MRKSYQINSFQNELFAPPQECFRNVQPTNHVFSSPVSPKAVPNLFQIQSFKVSTPSSPNTPFALKPQEQYR